MFLSKQILIHTYLSQVFESRILSLFAQIRDVYQEARFHFVTCQLELPPIFFSTPGRHGARGCAIVPRSISGAAIRRNPFVPWVGGFQSIGRFRHYQSNMSWPGKSNFPIISRSRARARARARVWETCVSPMRSAMRRS